MHVRYLRQLVAQVDAQPEQKLSPATQRLKDAIEAKSHLYMHFTEMFTEIPRQEQQGQNQTVVRDYNHMLQLLSHIVKKAPPPGLGIPVPPMALILTDPANTASGLAAFSDPEVNILIKGILNEWADFLGSADSLPFVQNGVDGWLDRNSLAELEQVANLEMGEASSFSELFECDAQDKYYGFRSWDDFFTRRFRPHMRPVANADDNSVVVNACESVPHTVGMKAKLRDTFFIKDQPYSVLDMLGHNPIAEAFDDSTVYQAFLSMHSYHRWHAPISGKIHSAYVVDGTYYSLPRSFGADRPGVTFPRKPQGFGHAMRYLSEMGTRAVIIIEADEPSLGLVAFVAVGMVEISTCEITVEQGQHVKKGDEMGSFHFGGSSYCLLFQDGVELVDLPSEGNWSSPNMPVLGKIATGFTAAPDYSATPARHDSDNRPCGLLVPAAQGRRRCLIQYIKLSHYMPIQLATEELVSGQLSLPPSDKFNGLRKEAYAHALSDLTPPDRQVSRCFIPQQL
ncbi:phosphatidylserine decarboxylase family protein [Beauveria brongniartii RCEF 3172]|uniref:Phosphatidylserine decarboxylase family protein n=1 Tax=Beauveria brongniartii RCEF 3172 TaxID=1081107 RepID=A0A166ZZY5_9HYPO|nr:phosphatidylserine decarboxylase family protein [Beauveria brongniartii RCEF 3172]